MRNNLNTPKIFVVEDDPMYVRLIKYVLEMNPDFEVHVFENGKSCLQQLHLMPNLVTLDYNLPDINGDEVLKKIKQHNRDTEVIVLSGQQDIGTAVDLLKLGAYDYITKDRDTKDRLIFALNNLQKNLSLRKEVETLREKLVENHDFKKSIIGDSMPMQKIFKLLQKAIKTNINVSITGETGTGKEVIAKAIHYNSERAKGDFVAVNVSAIPSELLESELFGHEKGAFTGANTQKKGQFELAHNGTLFLDEIAEMDINLQAKLLRALQEREVMRVGGTKPIKFDARIVVATHKNMAAEVEKGNFREDLYYRLLGLPIKLPPLRERGGDIMLLAHFFLKDFCKKNKIEIPLLDKSAKQKLIEYNFPGNVRELKAIIELAVVMCDGDKIEAEDIQFANLNRERALLGTEMTLKEYTRRIIFHYLDKYDNNVIAAAKKLDIGKSTIYRILKEEKP